MENKNENVLAEQQKAMEHDMATDLAEAVSNLEPETICKAIEEGVVGAYKAVEEGVVGAYKKVEQGAVNTYKKVEDSFVEKFFTKEGESVEDAKKRLQGK